MPRNCKKNVILGNFHCANKISSDLKEKIFIIKANYLKASYPNGLIDSAINYFHQTKEHFLIPPSLKEQKKITRYHFVKETKTNIKHYL